MERFYTKVFVLSVIVFVLGLVIGVYSFRFSEDLISFIYVLFGSIADVNENFALVIFKHNIKAILLTFVLGITIIAPLLIVLVNGYIIGLVLASVYKITQVFGGSFVLSIFSLIPHGIFELTAFFITVTLSTTFFLKLYLRTKVLKDYTIKKVWGITWKPFFVLVIPLITIAAFIESYISPRILEKAEFTTFNQSSFEYQVDARYKEITFNEYIVGSNLDGDYKEDYIFTIIPWLFLSDTELDIFKKNTPLAKQISFYQADEGDYMAVLVFMFNTKKNAEEFKTLLNTKVKEGDLRTDDNKTIYTLIKKLPNASFKGP